jgi:hypothetical protein
MGEIHNSDFLDIVGKKPPKSSLHKALCEMGTAADKKKDLSMNGEQKTACIIVACLSVVAICLVCCVTYYELTTFQQAIEAGLEQQYGANGGTIWVKSAAK